MTTPPLQAIALHGFLGAADDWAVALRYVTKPVRACSLPGHVAADNDLLSASTRETLAAQPSLDAWADALAEALRMHGAAERPVDVLGYSLGGRVSIALAERHPALVRRLVLVSASLGLEDPNARARRIQLDDERARALRGCDAHGFLVWLRAWYAQPLFVSLASDPERLERVITRRSRNHVQAMAAIVAGVSPGRAEYRGRWAAEAAVPTLWVAGSEDAAYAANAKRIAARMSSAEAVIVQGAGHALLETHPREVGEAINSWLGS